MLFFSFYLLTPLLPIYLDAQFHADKDMIGLVLSGYVVAALIVRPFSGFIVDSFDRKKVLMLCFFAFFICFTGYIGAGTLLMFALVRTIHGLPFGATTVANSTVAIDTLPSSRRNEGIGFYGLSNNLAMAIAPSAGIWIYGMTGNFDLLFWLTAGVCSALIVIGIALYVAKKRSLYRLVVCALVFLDIFAVVFFAMCATGIIKTINSVEALREYISGAGGMAALLFILFCFLQVVLLPVPGSVAVAAGVAMFGPLQCALYSFLGIVAGSLVAFAVGRWLGYKAVCWIVGKEDLDKWLDKMKGKDYLILSLMFLLPLFPDDILCFVAGLSSMTWLYFIVMIVITRAVSVLWTAYSFELIPFTTWWGLMIWAVILALVVAAFWLVLKYSDKIDAFIKQKFKLKSGKKRD